jgi:hypothetical protein
MTHFKVDIQLPLKFNPEEGGENIPQEYFFETYEELLKLASGISTNNNPIIGSWVNPKDKKRYDDKTIVFIAKDINIRKPLLLIKTFKSYEN